MSFSQKRVSALFVHVTTGLHTADKCLCRYLCEIETERDEFKPFIYEFGSNTVSVSDELSSYL